MGISSRFSKSGQPDEENGLSSQDNTGKKHKRPSFKEREVPDSDHGEDDAGDHSDADSTVSLGGPPQSSGRHARSSSGAKPKTDGSSKNGTGASPKSDLYADMNRDSDGPVVLDGAAITDGVGESSNAEAGTEDDEIVLKPILRQFDPLFDEKMKPWPPPQDWPEKDVGGLRSWLHFWLHFYPWPWNRESQHGQQGEQSQERQRSKNRSRKSKGTPTMPENGAKLEKSVKPEPHPIPLEKVDTSSFKVHKYEALGALHTLSVHYQRSKILSHYLVFKNPKGPEYQILRNPERLDTLRNDLEAYNQAEKNWQDWLLISDSDAYEKNKDLCETITPARILAITEARNEEKRNNKQEADNDGDRPKKEPDLGTEDKPLNFDQKEQEIFERHTRWHQPPWEVSDHYRKVWDKKWKRFWKNSGFAVFGGLWLIAPMLIMTLHPSKLSNLLTASFFIIAAGIALAWFMDGAEPKDIVSTAAAYAAVLVVFVGVQN